jgi:hypothetical protein
LIQTTQFTIKEGASPWIHAQLSLFFILGFSPYFQDELCSSLVLFGSFFSLELRKVEHGNHALPLLFSLKTNGLFPLLNLSLSSSELHQKKKKENPKESRSNSSSPP